MDIDTHWELPALKGTTRLGGQTESKLGDVFDVKFYPYTAPGIDPVFAVCAGSHVVVCRCVLDKRGAVEIIRWLESENEQVQGKELLYNSMAWLRAANGDPLLCVTGTMAQIRILNIRTSQLVTTLVGHGDEILDLAISPADPNILVSCSADHSIRLWSLDPAHQEKPLAAICHGQGHKDQVLTLAYHRKGRYLISGGMDTKINLWAVPDNLQEHAGTDKPALIHYPHFSTTEVHTDFIDCVRWYDDLILSHAAREDKIILWRIDGFSSSRATPPAPVPVSSALRSTTQVTVAAHSASGTRSAWGGHFQRLLQFELPNMAHYYMRFNIFHEMGRHPVLVAGNQKSRAFFWDLHRLEESDTGDAAPKGLPASVARHIRESSSASNASSATSTASGTGKGRGKKAKAVHDGRIGDPFRPIKAHKTIEVPNYNFTFRQFDWSRDGQWCVGTGDHGLIHVFNRWEKGAPAIKTDMDVKPAEVM